MGLLDTAPPAAKFPAPGTVVAGEVIKDGEEMQCRDFDTGAPEFWDDGKPKMQLVVWIQGGKSEDTQRALYIKGQMLQALREDCRRTRAKAILEGGHLTVTYVRDEPLPKGKRGNPKKIYEVKYVPPEARGGLPAAQLKQDSDEPPF